MTLFTKNDCRLCELLKRKFDLSALKVKVEVLDGHDAGALSHLAWHGLVETARKSLPLLVLDDSSSVADFSLIERELARRAQDHGVKWLPLSARSVTSCDSGTCSL